MKVDDKEHLQIGKADFVFEHKGKAFNEVYKTDATILGEGIAYLILLSQAHLERFRNATRKSQEKKGLSRFWISLKWRKKRKRGSNLKLIS